MQLAIASGKGGTGKTTLALALALVSEAPVTYLDCDVENPNGELFLKSRLEEQYPVTVLIPEFAQTRCKACGRCAAFCQFHAISLVKQPLLFKELCHSCGGCIRICPEEAISETAETVGSIRIGWSDKIRTVQGLLNVGQAMAPPVIQAVKTKAADSGLTIIDCPPGVACPLVSAIAGVDFVLLVSEPTPFGLHDLKLAVSLLRQLKTAFAVLVNRSNIGDRGVVDWCQAERISVLLEIPEKRALAEAGSRGQHLLAACPEIGEEIKELLRRIEILSQAQRL